MTFETRHNWVGISMDKNGATCSFPSLSLILLLSLSRHFLSFFSSSTSFSCFSANRLTIPSKSVDRAAAQWSRRGHADYTSFTARTLLNPRGGFQAAGCLLWSACSGEMPSEHRCFPSLELALADLPARHRRPAELHAGCHL